MNLPGKQQHGNAITREQAITHCSIGFRFSATLNGASVFALISSTVTPSACSISVRPLAKSTSKTAYNTPISPTFTPPRQ